MADALSYEDWLQVVLISTTLFIVVTKSSLAKMLAKSLYRKAPKTVGLGHPNF
jgi:hypothetical protein